MQKGLQKSSKMSQGQQNPLSYEDIYDRFLKGKRRINKETVQNVNKYISINKQKLYRIKRSFENGPKKAVGKEPHFTDGELLSWKAFILNEEVKKVQLFLKLQLSNKKPHINVEKKISLKYVYALKKNLPLLSPDNFPNIDKTTRNSNSMLLKRNNSQPIDPSSQLESKNCFSGMSDESYSFENPSSYEQSITQFSESLFGEQHSMSEIRQNQNITPYLTSNYEEDFPEEKRILTREHLIRDSFYQTPQQQGHSIWFSNENLGQEKMNHEEDLNQSELDKPPILNECAYSQDYNESEIDYLE